MLGYGMVLHGMVCGVCWVCSSMVWFAVPEFASSPVAHGRTPLLPRVTQTVSRLVRARMLARRSSIILFSHLITVVRSILLGLAPMPQLPPNLPHSENDHAYCHQSARNDKGAGHRLEIERCILRIITATGFADGGGHVIDILLPELENHSVLPEFDGPRTDIVLERRKIQTHRTGHMLSADRAASRQQPTREGEVETRGTGNIKERHGAMAERGGEGGAQ